MENFVGGLHDTFDLGIAHQHFELLVSVGYPYSTRMWTLVKLTVWHTQRHEAVHRHATNNRQHLFDRRLSPVGSRHA